MRVSTTTKNTLFDVSSPDAGLQTEVFEVLSKLDVPQMSPVKLKPRILKSNRFLIFAGGFHEILNVAEAVKISTSPIHVGNGLLSEFFIKLDEMDHHAECSDAKYAFRYFKECVLLGIRVINIHIKSSPAHNVGRRMALSLYRESVRSNGLEKWFYFDQTNISVIQKQIIECMREVEVSA